MTTNNLIEFPFLNYDIKTAKSIQVDTYTFKLYSIGERGTQISSNLLSEVVTGLINKIVSCYGKEFDSIVTIQTSGAMWSMPIALWANKPLYIFTTESNGTEGIQQQRPYQPRLIYAPNLSDVGKCIIIDDVISGGGTIKQLKEIIEKQGGEVLGAFCVIDKHGKAKALSKELGTHVCALITDLDTK